MRFRQNRNDRRSSVMSFLFSLETHSQYFIIFNLGIVHSNSVWHNLCTLDFIDNGCDWLIYFNMRMNSKKYFKRKNHCL